MGPRSIGKAFRATTTKTGEKNEGEEEEGGGGRETTRKIKLTGDILILRQSWITDCNLRWGRGRVNITGRA